MPLDEPVQTGTCPDPHVWLVGGRLQCRFGRGCPALDGCLADPRALLSRLATTGATCGCAGLILLPFAHRSCDSTSHARQIPVCATPGVTSGHPVGGFHDSGPTRGSGAMVLAQSGGDIPGRAQRGLRLRPRLKLLDERQLRCWAREHGDVDLRSGREQGFRFGEPGGRGVTNNLNRMAASPRLSVLELRYWGRGGLACAAIIAIAGLAGPPPTFARGITIA